MNDHKILMAYATQYGTTREVADLIAETMTEIGLPTDALPAATVEAPEQYYAYILGAPLYIGQLHGDMRRFIARNKFLIQQRPTALFSLGPITTEPDEMRGAVKQFEGQLKKFGWFQPVATKVFIGAYNPSELEGMHKLFTSMAASPLYGLPATDNRDWNAIRTWVEQLVELLAPTLVS